VTGRAGEPRGRLAWIDQLRTLAIVLVVNMHACVTYSHVGSWYVNDGPDPNPLTRLAFILWQAHLQSFFMGILFLVAGYFAHGSLRRRGPGAFMAERLARLGLPTLLYVALLHPLIVYVINPWGSDVGPLGPAYARYFLSGRFLDGTGPMWFAAALLAFSALLATVRAAAPLRGDDRERPAPRPGAVAAWAAGLALVTFLVRTAAPVGSAFHNMQLCYFPQYVLAFATGVAAARGRWLQPLARSALACRAGWAALVLGPVVLGAVLLWSGALRGREHEAPLLGGWNAASLGLSAWEQVTGTGLGLGALAFCSGLLDRSTALSRWLAERSFAVYLFHPPLLVLITVALRPWNADPFFKVSALTAAGLAASFLVADVARRLPGIRAIL
jgi:peptidoglycan/LPS O-acetylase OafA/YrhL